MLVSEAARRDPNGASPELEHPPARPMTPSPPDAPEVERITKRMQELKTTYIGNVARPILDRALEPSDYRLTPSEIAKLRRRAESLRQVVQAMENEGFHEDASILSHIIGDLLSDAKLAEVQWGQLSQSAKNYWLMKRDHPEWQVQGNALLDMTGAIIQESQSLDVQFVMSILVGAMTDAPPRRPVTAGPPVSPPKPYATSRGELIGSIPGQSVVGRTYGSAPYGQAVEPGGAALLRQRFPATEFDTSNTGKGGTGPDVVWTGGKDPGFDGGTPGDRSGWTDERGPASSVGAGRALAGAASPPISTANRAAMNRSTTVTNTERKRIRATSDSYQGSSPGLNRPRAAERRGRSMLV